MTNTPSNCLITALIALIVSAVLTTFTACAASLPDNDDELTMKIGQMIMVGFRGTSLEEADTIREDIEKLNLGGVVLFDYDVPTRTPGRNITDPDQLRNLTRELQSIAKTPLFIAVDQEGGRVARLKPKYGFPETVSAEKLGTLNNPDSTYRATLTIAAALETAGINMNFAPVIDLDRNPDNPVIGGLERSFSPDPGTVSSQAAAVIRALHEKNVISSLKHFPGHGSSSTDTHKDFTDITGSWNKTELAPYRSLIENGYNDLVMTAHVFNAKLDPEHPATLSKPVVTELLRDSLGFRGVVISDDMQMQAVAGHYSPEMSVRLAIEAGIDILLFANNSSYDPNIARKAVSIVRSLVNSGTISPSRIDSSYNRITALKQRHFSAPQ